MDDVDLKPSLLGGRYLVGAVIGRGGMAVVYRAWDSVLNRDVAVKVLSGLVIEPAARARFEAEGQILADLNHPGLTMLHDAGTQDDRPYLVMELIEGTTLTRFYQRQFLEPVEVAAIGAALADALAYVHARGIAHRDVKPSNVLLDHDRRVRLADFGIARLLDSATRHTATGLIVGTAAYLPPEQVRGEPTTRAGDIYALSLVLLEALAGRPVYTGAPHLLALARLVNPPQIDQSLPALLRDLLAAMSADLPGDRPTAAEVGARLHDITRELTPVPSAAMGQVARVRRPRAEAPDLQAARIGTNPGEPERGSVADEPVTTEPVTTDSVTADSVTFIPITEPSGSARGRLTWATTGLAVAAVVAVLVVTASPIVGGAGPSRPPATHVAAPGALATVGELPSPMGARAQPAPSRAPTRSSVPTLASAVATAGSRAAVSPRRLPPSAVTAAATTVAPTSSGGAQPKSHKKPKKPKKPKKK